MAFSNHFPLWAMRKSRTQIVGIFNPLIFCKYFDKQMLLSKIITRATPTPVVPLPPHLSTWFVFDTLR